MSQGSAYSFAGRQQPGTSGDGFTQEEIDKTLHPLRHEWKPPQYYKKTTIGDTAMGAVSVEITGRIVHFSTRFEINCVFLTIKDDTGALTVGYIFPLILRINY